ncbi:MAG TPA: hypothetical protein VK789_22235 [Bryobacteraceae bacterium]|nr:hypothetical protein [Bryobacteraceae bacterium]
MQNRFFQIVITLGIAPLCVNGQWLNQPDPMTPHTREGKPNLAARAPRDHGKPDLSGIWQTESTPRKELAVMFPPGVGLLPGGENGLGEDDPLKYFLNILADYKMGQEPFTPAAAALFRQRMQNPRKPYSLCTPMSLPVAQVLPAPFKVVQKPGLTLMLYESDNVFRQIFTDGRKHPVDPQPSWMGYSIGHWEGDWFVIDTVGFNDRADLDAMGHFHSDAMRITERLHRRDFGHMEVRTTIDDPKTFTKPITIEYSDRLLPETDVMENFCSEDEKDLAHQVAQALVPAAPGLIPAPGLF